MNDTFIEFHLYWTDKNTDNSIAMKTFNELTSKIENVEGKQKIEDLLKTINKGRPKFNEVNYIFIKKKFLNLSLIKILLYFEDIRKYRKK